MKNQSLIQLLMLLLFPLTAPSQLAVSVAAPKVVGSKTLIKAQLKNGLTNRIESARATMFLLDEQGKLAAQSTKWVIGGHKDRLPLEPNKEATYNFVFTVKKPFSETKLTFNRIILTGGKLVDPIKNVQITE